MGRRRRSLASRRLVKYCNCAACDREILGESMAKWYGALAPVVQMKYVGLVAGRIEERPYCALCYEKALTRYRKTGEVPDRFLW